MSSRNPALPLLVWSVALGVCAASAVARSGTSRSPARIDRLVIDKSEHRMEAWSGHRLIRTYSVAIGRGGAGPKRFEGDGRTPEGTYRVSGRHPSEKFDRFIAVSYPNRADRARYAALVAEGEVPRGAGIGGDIGIHGAPAGLSLLPHKLVDWTSGCIALDNAEIETLYRTVTRNATIVIQP